MITPEQTMSMQAALSSVESEMAGKTGALNMVTTIATISDKQDFDLGDVFEAYGLGAKSKGDKMLCKVLSASYAFVGPWVTLVIFTYGVFAGVRDIGTLAGKLWNVIRSVVTLFDPSHLVTSVWAKVKAIFSDQGNDGITDVFKQLPNMLGVVSPSFTMIYNMLTSALGDNTQDNGSRPEGTRANSLVVGPEAGGFDIAYDNGQEVDETDLSPGDIAYDEGGKPYAYDGEKFVEA